MKTGSRGLTNYAKAVANIATPKSLISNSLEHMYFFFFTLPSLVSATPDFTFSASPSTCTATTGAYIALQRGCPSTIWWQKPLQPAYLSQRSFQFLTDRGGLGFTRYCIFSIQKILYIFLKCHVQFSQGPDTVYQMLGLLASVSPQTVFSASCSASILCQLKP